jgi:pyruvate phosphate dikinase-like enzyme
VSAPGTSTSLRDEIALRLGSHVWPPDFRELDASLDAIRHLIKDAAFPTALRTSVLEALMVFEPGTRIRFRSSTNVEDSETFTGAGLYDSATGCLADDLDGDDSGPSRCNPAELEEHGVFRAIQRVYSSFYSRNAYLERLRRGVDETDIGMGVLVHYSVPDSTELANGVATLSFNNNSARTAHVVSQTGAASVTNPDGSALPEEVRISRFVGDVVTDSLSTPKTSSLLPLGAHVLDYDAEYKSLMTLFNRVADEYVLVTGKTPPLLLDFEFKKILPGELSLRQVRPLPVRDSTLALTPFFLGQPTTFCVYGGENGDAFATHRLKTRIALDGRSALLTADELAVGFYTQARVDYIAGAAVQSMEGNLADFPAATHVVQPGVEATLLDSWTAAGATWTLSTRLPLNASREAGPVVTSDDSLLDLTATWMTPVPAFGESSDGSLAPATRTEEKVELRAYCPEGIEVTSEFPHIEQNFSGPGGLTVQTSYWYPPPPRGLSSGYTAPAIKWERTLIGGLTTRPIVLTGYYSQTYAPKHHNAGGEYIFEPRIEPGLPEETLAELEAANVAYLIIVDRDSAGANDEIWVLGIDGTLRRW